MGVAVSGGAHWTARVWLGISSVVLRQLFLSLNCYEIAPFYKYEVQINILNMNTNYLIDIYYYYYLEV